MATREELKKAIWEVIQENDWMLVNNQNIDWLIENACKKLGVE
jgi:hypothetical protein